MKSDFEKAWEYVEKLEKENAELKAQLQNAQECLAVLSKVIEMWKNHEEN